MNEVLVVVVVAVMGAVTGAALAYAWSQRPPSQRPPIPRPPIQRPPGGPISYGAPRPPLPAPSLPAPPAPAPARPRSRPGVLRGADVVEVVTASGVVMRVRSGTIVGRAAGCDVRLVSAEVSRRHALIYNAGGTWFVGDLGSTNGTVVDGVAVRGASPLREGALLWLGGRRGVGLVVRRPAATAHPATSPRPRPSRTRPDLPVAGLPPRTVPISTTKVLETSRG